MDLWLKSISLFILALLIIYVISRLDIKLNIKKTKFKSISRIFRPLSSRWIVPIVLIAFSVATVMTSSYTPIFSANVSKIKNNTIHFDKPNTTIKIKIDTGGVVLPSNKSDGKLNVLLGIDVDGKEFNTYGTISVQGSSTALWPKKNWAIKFYSDEKREKDIYIKIGDHVATNKLVTKAEWIDPTMLRNALSYSLWDNITDSRKETPKYEVDHAFTDLKKPAKTSGVGYPVTYPAIVTVNDEFYGISTLIDAHEPNNFNIDKNNPNHVYMEFDARGGSSLEKAWTKFKTGLDIDTVHLSSYLSDDGDFTDKQKIAIDSLGDFINSPQSNFNKYFNNHLDQQNLIDMLIYIEAVGDWDGIAQDLEIVSYDLNKWFFLPWDKDTTFGLWFDGSGLRDNILNNTVINYDNEEVDQVLWYKVYHALSPQIEKRYRQLRNDGVLSVQNIESTANNIYDKISQEDWDNETDKWQPIGRPSVGETNLDQILDWFNKRLKILDQQFNYKSH